jgi:phosphonate transport system substrate-binding protein
MQRRIMMKEHAWFVCLALLVGLVLGSGPVLAEEPLAQLNFGVIPTESTANMSQGFEPFRADMEKALGIPVKLFFASDYAGIIEGMRFNKVQVAWFGNKSAIEAVNRAQGEVFAQTVDVEGNPGYWSLIVVHKDSPYHSIEDIIRDGKKLTFGNGDPNSTSGYLIPTYYLWAQRHIDPVKYFKVVRSANHETNLMAVANKQVDFATNNTENLSKAAKTHPEAVNNLRVIWKSPLIPSDPLVWRKDLPKEWKSRIKGFILAYGRFGQNKAHELEVLRGMSSGWAPFLDSSNLQLLPIMEINIAKDKMKIEGSDAYSAADKAQKLAEIDHQLGEIRSYNQLLAKFN